MDTFAHRWHKYTLRRAITALFSHKASRAHLHVQIEDIVPPVAIVLGRLIMDIQHLFKMHEVSVMENKYTIDGWPVDAAIFGREMTGCLNMWVLGSLVAYLCPDWASKLHQHVMWTHMIWSFLTTTMWDKSAEFFEQHFQNYKRMGKANPDTILAQMAFYVDEVMEKRANVRGGQSAVKHEALRVYMDKLKRPWRTPMIPAKLADLAGGDWWTEFETVTKPFMKLRGLKWQKTEKIIFLQFEEECPASSMIESHVNDVLHGADKCGMFDTEHPSFMHKTLSEFADLAKGGRTNAKKILQNYPPAALVGTCMTYTYICHTVCMHSAR
jgi:hypothetical protein